MVASAAAAGAGTRDNWLARGELSAAKAVPARRAGPPGRATAPVADQVSAELAQLAAFRAALRDEDVYVGTDGERITVERIRSFLEDRGSPMADHAVHIVAAGVRYDVDPRVVVAISAIESGYGRHQAGHNAWGWGGGAGGARWPDWPTAIHEYTAGLSARYDTDNIDVAFARRYVPPNWAHWLNVVHSVMAQI